MNKLKLENVIKYVICTGFVIFGSLTVTAQSFYVETPDSLKKNAVTFKTNLRMDFFNNFTGGIDKGGGYLGEADMGLTFDSDKTGWWKGGEFFIQGMNTHGKNPSANVTGDFQTFSNIDAENHVALYEAWYCQHFFDDKFSVIFGQLDMNADFSISDNAMNFINSSFGVIPTLSLNNSLSIFPLLSLGAGLKLKFWKKFAFQTAVYNGNSGDFTTNPNAVNWKFSKSYGYYSISELHLYNKKDTISTGTYKFGFFYHSGQYYKWENVDTLACNYGFYLIADQMLIPKDAMYENGLNGFVQASFFPSDRNFLTLYLGGGLRYHGPWKKRKYDDFGIAFAYSNVSDKYVNLSPDILLRHETAIELMYSYRFNENIRVQPEFQYVINPGAIILLKNTLVGLIRFHITL